MTGRLESHTSFTKSRWCCKVVMFKACAFSSNTSPTTLPQQPVRPLRICHQQSSSLRLVITLKLTTSIPICVNTCNEGSVLKAQCKRKRFKFRNIFRSHQFIPYFQEKGLTIQDLPKAIVCHELMGYVILGLTWTACYHFPISDISFLKGPMDRLTSVVPKTFSESVSCNPFLCSKYGKAYMESACLRKLMRPITLPGKLFLTYKMVQILPDIGLPSICLRPSITDCTAYIKAHGNEKGVFGTENNKIVSDDAIEKSTAPGTFNVAIEAIEGPFCSFTEEKNTIGGALNNGKYINFSDLDSRYKPFGLKGSTLRSNCLSRL